MMQNKHFQQDSTSGQPPNLHLMDFVTCPRCGNSCRLKGQSGNLKCEKCGLILQFARFDLQQPLEESTQKDAPTSNHTCHYHPTSEAKYYCETCKKAICDICATRIGNKIVCPDCMIHEPIQTEESCEYTQFSWAGAAVHILFFSLFIPFLSVFLTLFSFYGLSSLKNKRFSLGKRTLLFCAALSVVVTILWVIGTFIHFRGINEFYY